MYKVSMSFRGSTEPGEKSGMMSIYHDGTLFKKIPLQSFEDYLTIERLFFDGKTVGQQSIIDVAKLLSNDLIHKLEACKITHV